MATKAAKKNNDSSANLGFEAKRTEEPNTSSRRMPYSRQTSTT